jgi:hypothetical protein
MAGPVHALSLRAKKAPCGLARSEMTVDDVLAPPVVELLTEVVYSVHAPTWMETGPRTVSAGSTDSDWPSVLSLLVGWHATRRDVARQGSNRRRFSSILPPEEVRADA